MNIGRLVLFAVAALAPASAALAQDHSAHAGHAQQPLRTLGGSFVLRVLNGTAIPASNPDGSGSMILGGTLELRLARPDSGRMALRFRSNVPATDEARLDAEGRVQVTGDSLLFWPDSRASRPPVPIRFAWTAERALDLMPAPGVVWSFTRAADSDTAFAGVQARGAAVMGVDQYTSTHVFEPLADGGRIALQTDSIDTAGEETIRAHMRDIAERFAKGDFTLPGMVHAMPSVPGTAVMTARRAAIRYVVESLPRGAQVRIITRDAEAIKAVHEFLAFQRMDHRAMSHDPR
ncbi:MAG: hypothetical protein K8S21_12110 [Gemmatimonadetes bacterium]|nr:hypothetical protein [Gemmatimonadota bacterium]